MLGVLRRPYSPYGCIQHHRATLRKDFSEILDCKRDFLLSIELFLSSDSRVNPA